MKIFQLLKDTIHNERVAFMNLYSLHNPKSNRKVKLGFSGGSVVKNPPANAGNRVREDPTCCGATKPVRHNY